MDAPRRKGGHKSSWYGEPILWLRHISLVLVSKDTACGKGGWERNESRWEQKVKGTERAFASGLG
jgi:predicted RNase H-like nuclease (RuvC/YqgF family)